MYRRFAPSSSSLFVCTIRLLALFLIPLGISTAQVRPAQVSALKFTQHELPIGTAAYGNGSSDAIVTGDFNNDGILDVVTIDGTTSGMNVSFFRGLGNGKFSTTPVSSPLSEGASAGGPAFAADLNGDGKLDLAIAAAQGSSSSTGPVTIMLGNGDGTFTQGQNITVSTSGGAANASAIALADFNGDHVPDIAVSDGNIGYTWVYLGKGDGTFTLASTQSYGGNSVVVGDFNADGKQDVAFASNYGNPSNRVGVFLGNGNGTLNGPILATVSGGTGSVSGTTGLAVGDFYNDRIQSLAVLYSVGQPDQNYTTYVATLRFSDGKLLVGPLNQVTGPQAEGPTYVSGGDLNGDFVFDVFIAGGGYYENPLTAYMLGNGDGTFQSPLNTPYDTQASTFVFPILRDLNLDSRHDVALAWSNVVDDNGGGDVLINQNARLNCDPPAARALSVNICAPKNGDTIDKTYTFKGAGNAFNGLAKRMELWIDGVKIGQDLEDQLSITTTLEPGTHTASFVVVDSFDSYTSQSVTFTTR